MLRRAAKGQLRWVATIALLAIAGTLASVYILVHERFPVPFETTYGLSAEFSGAAGVVGGAGLPVTVAGVKVGTIRGVSVRDGRAVVAMAIDPHELPHVYSNVRADLVPDTPLKDMEVRLSPGGPPAHPLRAGATIPLANTSSPIDLDQLLGALDTDTRQYLTTLLSGLDGGTRGRGLDVRAILRALGPTITQTRQLGATLVGRRRDLQHVVHDLALVSGAAATKDRQLAQVVDAGASTLSAVADQDRAVRASLTKLPLTLAHARHSLNGLTRLSEVLPPTVTALRPFAQRLPSALRALGPLAGTATPIIRDRLRPFVRALQPIARTVVPAVRDLNAQTPDLTSAFQVLRYVANETGYNQPGTWPGFLYWTAWAAHNAASAGSVADAHGPAIRALLAISCTTVTSHPQLGPVLPTLLGKSPAC